MPSPRAALLLVCFALVGCGGDDGGSSDDGGSAAEALPKAEFVEQANAICKEESAKLEEATAEIDSAEAAEAFLTDTLVPSIRGQVAQIRELGIPEGDEDTVNGFLDDTDAVLDTIEDDPQAAAAGDDPFTDVSAALSDYGLTECAT